MPQLAQGMQDGSGSTSQQLHNGSEATLASCEDMEIAGEA
jgi:hypothetical protein